MKNNSRLDEKISEMRRLMLIREGKEVIPYAEEMPDEDVYSKISNILVNIKSEYSKAKKYVDIEVNKVMAGTSLIDLIKDVNLGRSKEQELEHINEFYEKRCEYYDELIDDFQDNLGYNNSVILEIKKYYTGLYNLSKDMWDIAQVWYKLYSLAEEISEKYEEDPKSRKALINIKTTEI